MKKNLSLLWLPSMLLVLYTPYLALAHGEGQSIEKTIGEYSVKLEYETLELQVGEPTRFDFETTKANNNEDVPFSSIWVRITQGNKTIFAGGIAKSDIGKTGLTYTFPEAGDYELSTRFQDNKGESIVEAAFPLKIAAASIENRQKQNLRFSPQIFLGVFIGLIVGYALSLFIKRRT